MKTPTCPLCGCAAYVGFTAVECEGPGCANYVKPKPVPIAPVPIAPVSLGYPEDDSATYMNLSKAEADDIHRSLAKCMVSFASTQITFALLNALAARLSDYVLLGVLPKQPSVHVRQGLAGTLEVRFSKWFCDAMRTHGHHYIHF